MENTTHQELKALRDLVNSRSSEVEFKAAGFYNSMRIDFDQLLDRVKRLEESNPEIQAEREANEKLKEIYGSEAFKNATVLDGVMELDKAYGDELTATGAVIFHSPETCGGTPVITDGNVSCSKCSPGKLVYDKEVGAVREDKTSGSEGPCT